VGVDIDPTVKEDAMRENFSQHGLAAAFTGLVTGDIGNLQVAARAVAANGGQPFDAVICDPPYGFREMNASRKADSEELTRSNRELAAMDAAVALTRLCVAEEPPFLRAGGRLVYFLPAHGRRGTDPAELASFVPTHPSLRLREVTMQQVSQRLTRWLVVMDKVEVGGDDTAGGGNHGVVVRPGHEAVVGYNFKSTKD